MYKKSHKTRQRNPTNGKCEGFINANCSYNCPNAKLESACDRWDLDPSDFGMEYIKCRECMYRDEICTCEDCFMQRKKDYCPKEKVCNMTN